MTINITTLEANLTTKINATTGTTEGKEFLLLSKSVESLGVATSTTSLAPANNLSDVSNVATSRTNLGLAIGTDVQAYDATILNDADIGVNVQAYDATILNDADIGVSLQAYDANLTSFVAAVTLPTADGTTGQFLKTDGSGNVTFATIPTINTLNDVGNVTITSAASGQYLQWNGTAWINAAVEAFNVQTLTTTAVTQVAIASYAVATYGGVKVVITAHDSVATERSITEIIITHDGTTAVATEYAQVNTATALATFDVDISGGNVRILATPASTNSTAFTVKAITL
jgi:hypothetical protein|tara:strand:+ start:531 stop:1394 length:864 start_codon:yes stop_codon:yes gene_type:complete